MRDALVSGSPASPSRRSSRSSRASPRSSTTATSSSTRSRRRRTAPRSASTAPAAGTRCSTSEKCWLTTDLGNGIRDAVRDWAREEGLEAYSQEDGSGYLRHLVVREGRNTRQALVQLVTAPGEKFEPGYFVDVLRRFPEVRSVHWSVNDTPAEVTNLPTRLLWGEEWIEEELCGLRFRVRPNAFLQTNTAMAERLYGLARDAAQLTRQGDRLGSLLRHRHDRPLARRGRADGVGDRGLGGVGRLRARERRAERHHERGVLRRATSAQVVEELLERSGAPDVVVVDPPRAGLAGQGAAPPRPDRRAAARLRLVQPDDARLRREGAAGGVRLRAAARDARSTCSRTRRTSRRVALLERCRRRLAAMWPSRRRHGGARCRTAAALRLRPGSGAAELDEAIACSTSGRTCTE